MACDVVFSGLYIEKSSASREVSFLTVDRRLNLSKISVNVAQGLIDHRKSV